MFCPKCGVTVADGAGFCPQCGSSIQSPAPGGASAGGTSGLKENVASLLCYVAGWITGVIFFLIDKRSEVKFHAMQSILIFGIATVFPIVRSLLNFIPFVGGLLGVINWVISVLSFVLYIVCIIKASKGEHYKVPFIGDWAEKLSGSVKI